jgi:ABC-type Co2+ transport system permease subunit
MLDISELIKKIIKYLVLGLVISVVAIVIPRKPLNLEEVILLALSAAATFSILDVFLPSVGESARFGLGATVGSNLIGGLRMAAM